MSGAEPSGAQPSGAEMSRAERDAQRAALASLAYGWRNPEPRTLALAAGQAPETRELRTPEAMSAWLSEPAPREGDLHLHVLRGGQRHTATASLDLTSVYPSRARHTPEEAQGHLRVLDLSPGDVVYATLIGWDRSWSVAHWTRAAQIPEGQIPEAPRP